MVQQCWAIATVSAPRFAYSCFASLWICDASGPDSCSASTGFHPTSPNHQRVLLPWESLQVVADPVAAPSLQRGRLGFDHSLGFLQSHGMVGGWLVGQQGVVIPRGGEAFPYSPPFVKPQCAAPSQELSDQGFLMAPLSGFGTPKLQEQAPRAQQH